MHFNTSFLDALPNAPPPLYKHICIYTDICIDAYAFVYMKMYYYNVELVEKMGVYYRLILLFKEFSVKCK
jgi:hypothetical protein